MSPEISYEPARFGVGRDHLLSIAQREFGERVHCLAALLSELLPCSPLRLETAVPLVPFNLAEPVQPKALGFEALQLLRRERGRAAVAEASF